MTKKPRLTGDGFIKSVEKYVEACLQSERIPNRAGYLRFMKMTQARFTQLCEKYPEEAELVDLIFEDEALNTSNKKVSSSVLNLYLKERFGYGGEVSTGGEVKVICSHEDYEE